VYLKYIFPLFFITGCRGKKIMSLYLPYRHMGQWRYSFIHS